MAEKLEYSLSGYKKIEHGETDLQLSKLAKIAELLGVNLQHLLGLNENNVFNVAENFANNSNSPHCTVVLSETQCAHELEKSQLIIKQNGFIIEQKDKEIGWLQKEIGRLEKIIGLLEERKA